MPTLNWIGKEAVVNRWFFLFGFEKNDRANISAE
jgi:hypothetical protein